MRAWYDTRLGSPKWTSDAYRTMLAHYYGLLVPEDASVLEIGCGTGALLARLKARRKVGIDLSSQRIELARARVPEAEFHVQAAEALDLPERFDYILISDTLNFAADVQHVMERIARRLAPGHPAHRQLPVGPLEARLRPGSGPRPKVGGPAEQLALALRRERPHGTGRLGRPHAAAEDPLPGSGALGSGAS